MGRNAMVSARFIAFICVMFALSACSISNLEEVGAKPTLKLAEEVEVLESDDAPIRTYVSSEIKLDFASYHLQTIESQPPDTGLRVQPARGTQLFVTMSYSGGGLRPGGIGFGLIEYDSANDDSGNSLAVLILDRKVFCRQGCMFTEQLAIELPESFVEANVQTGFQIVVRNGLLGYGDYTLDVPPNYITAHIMAYRALTKQRPSRDEPEIEI